jgi:hypothetical protein
MLPFVLFVRINYSLHVYGTTSFHEPLRKKVRKISCKLMDPIRRNGTAVASNDFDDRLSRSTRRWDKQIGAEVIASRVDMMYINIDNFYA